MVWSPTAMVVLSTQVAVAVPPWAPGVTGTARQVAMGVGTPR